MDNVIVDTSAWVESFRPQGDTDLAGLMKDLILRGRILLPGIIKAEILRGARNRKEYSRLEGLLRGLTYLPVPEDFWEKLADFSFRLYRKGIAVPLVDTYISLLCIEHDVPIIHNDKHFNLISQKFPLKIFNL